MEQVPLEVICNFQTHRGFLPQASASLLEGSFWPQEFAEPLDGAAQMSPGINCTWSNP